MIRQFLNWTNDIEQLIELSYDLIDPDPESKVWPVMDQLIAGGTGPKHHPWGQHPDV